MINVVLLAVALGIPATVFIASAWLRSRDRLRLLNLVRDMADADKPLSADVVQSMSGSSSGGQVRRDLRRGIMLTAIGTSFFLLGLLAFIGFMIGGTPQGVSIAIAIAVAAAGAIPICIGVALVLLSRTDR